MHVIGLTGGIASGKSTVARMLEKLGAAVIDADRIAREVVMPGEPAYQAIVATFGEGILSQDRTINRGALGKIVFADPKAREQLEKITHPAIGRRAEELLAKLRQNGTAVAFYMAPLLIEAGITSRVNEIWVVYVDQETQTERLMSRDGINRGEALQKIASQMPMDEKKRRARVVIDNRRTEAETEKQVVELWEKEIKKIMGRP